jgi:NAD-dependent SIR2 family protein deacetylase
MRHRVPLCTVCNVPTPSTSSTRGKKPKKKKKDKWDSDVEEESDIPDYPPGIMKVCSSSVVPCTQNKCLQPDITFFGEKLTDDFDRSLEADRESVDLLLVIGTSLKVAPVADILSTFCYFLHRVMTNGVS